MVSEPPIVTLAPDAGRALLGTVSSACVPRPSRVLAGTASHPAATELVPAPALSHLSK
ncbi:hypothetical protein [Amycolatopsis sp. SID8362]|uniref:hypothetical protein n=1 Tax=Amycolatopsis sp. SID8362 TaxID=2690346 RepID=UPI00136F61F7|nr:hypothetical protein [Amycolatopsis sp. SID8362]NBH09068.1 hypothetical protein [Amycolatopsis sp. SID8362]NED45760.1 hypothetical protein [Amycolatopsis sp. SID8362]